MARSPRPAELPRILYVDDDAKALELFRLQTSGEFAVTTASSGSQGIEILEKQGPFAVVVSDQKMIGMTGITLLSKARDLAPDTVRLLLTGYPDLTTAIAASNDGYVFRFMIKPCPRPVLMQVLQSAVDQHNLLISRRVLLEETLSASIKTLTGILAFASPAAFGRATRTQALVTKLLDHFAIDDRWEVEVAAMLSQIGSVSLPPETALKVYYGETLDPEERLLANHLPDVTEELIAGIPRLEGVARILRYQDKRYDGEGIPIDLVQRDQIPWGSRALKIALDFDILETQGVATELALATMRGRRVWYDPQLLFAFSEIQEAIEEAEEIQELDLDDVLPGMTFAEDVRTKGGMMVIARGTEVTDTLAERIRGLAAGATVAEPVKVIVATASSTVVAD